MSGTASERILAVARQKFLKLGFEKCSMDSVARSARVSKQSLYELYPTKRDLFTTVMRDAARLMRERIAPIVVDGRPPFAILQECIASYVTSFLTLENLGLYRTTLVAGRCFPDLADELHRQRVSGGTALKGYLARLAEEGHIQTNNPADLHRRLGSTAIEGMRYLMAAPLPSPQQQETLAHCTSLLILHGYRSPQANECADVGASGAAPEFVVPATGASMRLPPHRLEALFQSAANEFLAHGYRGANLTRILSAVGVSPATVYRQFGDKRGLFQHTMLHLCTALWSDAAPAPAHGETLSQSLHQLARWTLDRHLNPRNLALLRLLATEAEEFPELARWAYARMTDEPVRELHRRLGEFGEPAPNPIASRAFVTLATYGVRFIMTAEMPDEATRAALTAECVNLFLNGCAR